MAQINKDCFAYSENFVNRPACNALSELFCAKEKCNFYKPRDGVNKKGKIENGKSGKTFE